MFDQNQSFMDFTSLDLSDIEAASGFKTLSVGEHRVRISEAKVDEKQLVIEFTSVDGDGSIRQWLNLWHDSADARMYAMQKLKAVLENGGHPNPDRPGDVGTLKNLELNITVGMSKRWKGKDGEWREARAEVKAYAPLGADPLDDKLSF